MKNLIKNAATPEARDRRKASKWLRLHERTNRHPLRSHTVTDKASASIMAVHNIGAGGVNIFCSTVESMCSIKRMTQRNTRVMRAFGMTPFK